MATKPKKKKDQPVKPSRRHWRRLRRFAERWRGWSLRKRITVACTTLVITAAAICGLMIAIFIGILAGFPLNLVRDINPDSPRIVKAAAQAEADIERAENLLTDGTRLKFYAKDTANGCYRGQNNYMVSDGYASRCSFHATYYYGLNIDSTETLSKALSTIDKNLGQNEWEEPKFEEDTIKGAINRYEYHANDPTFTPHAPIGVYSKGSIGVSMKLNSKKEKYPNLFVLSNEADAKKIFENIAKDNDYAISIMIVNHYATKPSLQDGLL